MGCRTRVMANAYDGGEEVSQRRGNLSFTSINLPRIAIEAKGDIPWFYEELSARWTWCLTSLTSALRSSRARRCTTSLLNGTARLEGQRKAQVGMTRCARS